MKPRQQPPQDKPFDMAEPPPPGCRWELRPDKEWRRADLYEKGIKRCRRPGCTHVPAAALRRGKSWWLYCADHLYGRVIVDGVVMCRRAVPLLEETP